MNYDRIIIELLNRVTKLEEEVNKLKGNKQAPASSNEQTLFSQSKPDSYTGKICTLIEHSITKAKEEGKTYLDVVALDALHAVGLSGNRAPLCCNAMRKVGRNYRTQVLRDTKSHSSTTYTIRYIF